MPTNINDSDSGDSSRAYITKGETMLWSHVVKPDKSLPPRPYDPVRQVLSKWVWIGAQVLVLFYLIFKVRIYKDAEWSKAVPILIIGLLVLILAAVILKYQAVFERKVTSRHVFQSGYVTDKAVILKDSLGETLRLEFSDIKTVKTDFEQGAKAVNIIPLNGDTAYILMGAANFNEMIAIIKDRIN